MTPSRRRSNSSDPPHALVPCRPPPGGRVRTCSPSTSARGRRGQARYRAHPRRRREGSQQGRQHPRLARQRGAAKRLELRQVPRRSLQAQGRQAAPDHRRLQRRQACRQALAGAAGAAQAGQGLQHETCTRRGAAAACPISSPRTRRRTSARPSSAPTAGASPRRSCRASPSRCPRTAPRRCGTARCAIAASVSSSGTPSPRSRRARAAPTGSAPARSSLPSCPGAPRARPRSPSCRRSSTSSTSPTTRPPRSRARPWPSPTSSTSRAARPSTTSPASAACAACRPTRTTRRRSAWRTSTRWTSPSVQRHARPLRLEAGGQEGAVVPYNAFGAYDFAAQVRRHRRAGLHRTRATAATSCTACG